MNIHENRGEKNRVSSSSSEGKNWYLFTGTSYDGPYSTTALTELVAGGAVPAHAQVWQWGDERWREISQVEPFAQHRKALANFSAPRPAKRNVARRPLAAPQPSDRQQRLAEARELSRHLQDYQASRADMEAESDLPTADLQKIARQREQAWKRFYDDQGVPRKTAKRSSAQVARSLGAKLKSFSLRDHDRIASQERLKKEIRRRLSSNSIGRVVVDLARWAGLGSELSSALWGALWGALWAPIWRRGIGMISELAERSPVLRQWIRKWRANRVRWQVKGLIYLKAGGLLLAALLALQLVSSLFGRGAAPLALEDLTPGDRREIESAVNTSYLRHGAVGALAVSMFDPYAPVIFVGSNMEHETQLALRVEGIAETLVDQFKVSVQSSVVIKNGLGKSPVLRQAGGVQFPFGVYRAVLLCPSCAPSGKVLAEKEFTVGPGVADSDYRVRLADYHTRLQSQARDELTELKQLEETIANQLDETDSAFRRALDGRGTAERWESFHAQWSLLEEQIDSLVFRWSPEALDGGFYYASLYADLKRAVERLRALHGEQARYVLGVAKGAPRDLAVESGLVGDATNVRAQLQTLKTKVHGLSKRPALANGLPARL